MGVSRFNKILMVPALSRGHNIITYPGVRLSNDAADTTVNLLDQVIEYLHDNGFRLLTMANMEYGISTNFLYIK